MNVLTSISKFQVHLLRDVSLSSAKKPGGRKQNCERRGCVERKYLSQLALSPHEERAWWVHNIRASPKLTCKCLWYRSVFKSGHGR